jgi:hypothetical protein
VFHLPTTSLVSSVRTEAFVQDVRFVEDRVGHDRVCGTKSISVRLVDTGGCRSMRHQVSTLYG